MKKMKIVMIVMSGIVLIVAVLFIRAYWIPYKFAIKEGDLDKNKPYILVQEVHYTGSGWVQIGDEKGYFSPDEYKDVYLLNGDMLPQMSLYQKEFVNTFLCKVESCGKKKHVGFEYEIDAYDIKEWYPVYPVLRDTLLPDWMFPKGFMTKSEVDR